jgi:hypothetical protein
MPTTVMPPHSVANRFRARVSRTAALRSSKEAGGGGGPTENSLPTSGDTEATEVSHAATTPETASHAAAATASWVCPGTNGTMVSMYFVKVLRVAVKPTTYEVGAPGG